MAPPLEDLDRREFLILKTFADRFDIKDIEHMERMLREDDRDRELRRLLHRWGAWLGGILISAYAMRDGISALFKWLFRP